MKVSIPADRVRLDGDLELPDGAAGLVVFAHGSGSSRFSPRNRFVAELLRDAGLGTLLFDLLTREEEQLDLRTAELRFDIDLLGRRLVEAIDWTQEASEARGLPVGTFGSSTGAAAALIAAADRPHLVHAVVSRGGRVNLAAAAIPKVTAPTLLLVGAEDHAVLSLNRAVAEALETARLEIVLGATHLFEEPGTLEDVARRAARFFQEHLRAAAEARIS